MYIGPIRCFRIAYIYVIKAPVRFACATKFAFPADADDLTGLCALPSFDNIFAEFRFLFSERRAFAIVNKTIYKRSIEWYKIEMRKY